MPTVTQLFDVDQATYERLQRKLIRLRQAQAEAQRLQHVEAAMAELQDHFREQYGLQDGDVVRDTGEIVRANAQGPGPI